MVKGITKAYKLYPLIIPKMKVKSRKESDYIAFYQLAMLGVQKLTN